MPYASKRDMIDRFGEDELILNSNKGQSANAINDTTLNLALTDADAEINAYLIVRYVLPLVPVPAILVNLACQIGRYQLFGAAVTEEVRNRYKDAIGFLKNVAEGKASLDPASGTTPPATDGGPQFTAPDPTFDKDTLEDY